jgi:RNA polymerase sigma-70 factor, ECF subfamily
LLPGGKIELAGRWGGTAEISRVPLNKPGSLANPQGQLFVSICRNALILEQFNLASREELSGFLAETERRAYKQALFAVRDEHVALDIVQDAMLKLADKYAAKPPQELPMLFQRILLNTIRDYYRRQKVRSTWTTLISSLVPQHEEADYDPLDTLQDKDNNSQALAPDASLEQSQLLALIEEALMNLAPRQREAFLLRYWENMDTTETAAVMGCSEGSVKQHCSRAIHALSAALKAKGVDLS